MSFTSEPSFYRGFNSSLEICKNVDIDLFFIDIALKESSGLDFALKTRNIEKYKLRWIVFITTHINYMIQAFKEVHCYDYILKSYDPEKIIELTKTIIENTHSKSYTHDTEKSVVFNNKGRKSLPCLRLYRFKKKY